MVVLTKRQITTIMVWYSSNCASCGLWNTNIVQMTRHQFVWLVGVVLMKVVLRSTTRDSGALSVMMDGAGPMLM